jgi:hypothetical protein
MGRRLASRPKRAAVSVIHPSDPNGAPRLMLWRIRCISVFPTDSFTHRSHGSGLATGPESMRGLCTGAPHSRALDQRQSSARAANWARTGFCSIYRNTVSRCPSCSRGGSSSPRLGPAPCVASSSPRQCGRLPRNTEGPRLFPARRLLLLSSGMKEWGHSTFPPISADGRWAGDSPRGPSVQPFLSSTLPTQMARPD